MNRASSAANKSCVITWLSVGLMCREVEEVEELLMTVVFFLCSSAAHCYDIQNVNLTRRKVKPSG